MRGIAGANSHQNAVLVVGVRGLDCVTDVAGVYHALPSNLENNIAFLEASVCSGALRIDVGDNDAGFTCTCN